MIKLNFSVGGKTVGPSGVGDAMAAAMRRSTEAQLAARVAACRCPEHGESARLVVEGPPSKPSYKIAGCCQALLESAGKRLK